MKMHFVFHFKYQEKNAGDVLQLNSKQTPRTVPQKHLSFNWPNEKLWFKRWRGAANRSNYEMELWIDCKK